MAQVLTKVHAPYQSLGRPSLSSTRISLYGSRDAFLGNPHPRWAALQKELECEGRHSNFFGGGRKQEQARKALEGALGEKKTEFEKWNREIEQRQEKGGGGASGRGGWFGGGGWFGWFGGEHFWEEAQQAILAIIGIVSLYLLLAKGSVMFAVVFNSLLFVLRGARNWFIFISSHLTGKAVAPVSGSGPLDQMVSNTYQTQVSAKERVVRKWGTD
ncbi:uncharacterized protein LOC103718000 [Phoenix dactylifera]|uniref:Uncharacterized protein LOC103718000 n=1 Tax=Phoenix dactylifera TaxID=42345 RepID=A0A8B7CRJ4_PHODC|nr:uncharacterized protein LOC103718000 [Phoenix dactylifera]